MFNLAYSAPRGYDLRAPYNVPMGEIKVLRVVDPFSPSSIQQDTITTAFPRSCLGPSFSVARIIRCKQRFTRRCEAARAAAAAKSNLLQELSSTTKSTGSRTTTATKSRSKTKVKAASSKHGSKESSSSHVTSVRSVEDTSLKVVQKSSLKQGKKVSLPGSQ